MCLPRQRLEFNPIERIEKLSEDVVKRFFLRGDWAQAGFVRVRPELRAMVSSGRLNLLAVTGKYAARWMRFSAET